MSENVDSSVGAGLDVGQIDSSPAVEQASKVIPGFLKVVSRVAVISTLILVANEQIGVTDASSAVPKAQAAAITSKPLAKAPKNCSPNQQIKLSLIKREVARPGQAAYTLKATSCMKTTPKLLKNVRLRETYINSGHVDQKRGWTFKRFAPGQTKRRNFSIDSPKPQPGVYMPSQSNQVIVLEALSKSVRKKDQPVKKWRDRQLGKRIYKLLSSGEPYEIIPKDDIITPKECHPHPEYTKVIQDDRAILYQYKGPRSEPLKTAQSILGVTGLRINVIYGAVIENGGLEEYINTINEAANLGYNTVYLSIMPTPSYNPDMDQDLNYQNLNPKLMEEFARNVAKTVNARATRKIKVVYIIGNEPNHEFFNASKSKEKFNNMFVAGRKGATEGDPGAQVWPGGLAPDAPGNLNPWIKNHQTISGHITLHPYGYVMHRMPEIVKAHPGSTVHSMEYGNSAYKEDQAQLDAQAEEIARCSGVRTHTKLQLYRYPEITSWNTGIIDPPA